MMEQDFDRFLAETRTAIWRDLHPFTEEIESTGKLPHDRLMSALAQVKAFGWLLPEEYGGVGLSYRQYVRVLTELSKIHGAIRVLVHVHNSMAHAFLEMATEEQRQAVLPGAATGRASVAFALTEPGNGTGADISTTATRQGAHYTLNGHKWLITNADFASHFIVFAKTDSGRGARSVSAFYVKRGAPGFRIDPMPETMGCRGGFHGRLTFHDTPVPIDQRFGGEGDGLELMERALEVSRLFIAASSLGVSQRALELSVAFARRRVTFGRPIAKRQAIQRYLAEMATDVYALGAMIRDAAGRADRGERIPGESAMCKLYGLEAVGRVTDRALLVHGGVGYTRLHEIERLYRDARLNWLEEGPPTIQYLVATHALLERQDSVSACHC